jgi:hypothetical protein
VALLIAWTGTVSVLEAQEAVVDHGLNATGLPGETGRSAHEAERSPAQLDAANRERGRLRQVITYLEAAGLLKHVEGLVSPSGPGSPFHVTFRFAADETSKAAVMAILQNGKLFNKGPLGSAHVQTVGATSRTDVYDFRSRNGVLGPRSLEVMIHARTFHAYADLDLFSLYGGPVPALAHIFLEFLPNKLLRLF